MLIVIVIIGILAGTLIPRLMNAQERTRDMRRKTDITTIGTTLNTYYMDNGNYKNARNAYDSGRNKSTEHSLNPVWLDYLIPSYLSSIPLDPINSKKNSTNIWDKTNKPYVYFWVFYPPAYVTSRCSEFKNSGYGILGVVNFEGTPPENNLKCNVGSRGVYIDYSPALLVNGTYVKKLHNIFSL